MASIADEVTGLPDRTKRPAVNITDPYSFAITGIHAAIERYRRNRESLCDTLNESRIVDEPHRSQSPVGLTNEVLTIQRIEDILEELSKNYPIPPLKLSHDSSSIDADLITAEDDNKQIVPTPPRVIENTGQIVSTLPRTHPEDYAPYNCHIKEVGVFQKDLMGALRSSEKAYSKYKKVEVILLTWEHALDDDIRTEVEEDTAALLKLFRELNYTVTPVSLRRQKCLRGLKKALDEMIDKYVDYTNDDVLFIVHYNGHGSVRNKKSYWHPTGFAAKLSDASDPLSEPHGPTIEFEDVRKIFDDLENQDIFYILDCCAAGSAIASKGPSNTKELLAACGSGNRTLAKPSFTSRFVSCFRKQLKTDPVFQIGWLFTSMVNASQNPVPIHVGLNKSPTSICLSSLAPMALGNSLTISTTTQYNGSLTSGAFLGIGSPSSATSEKAVSIFSNDNDASDGNTRPTSTQEDEPPEIFDYEVFITVKLLHNTVPNAKGWQLILPSDQVESIKDVKVWSKVDTKSTLLLVTLPIRTWILLPDNPAYTFIDFVRKDTFFNFPETEPGPIPTPSPAIGPVERSDSDKSFRTPDHLQHIIAAMKDFFEKEPHKAKEKHGPIRRMTSKMLHASSHPLHSDPRYSLIRHIFQQFVVVHSENGDSRYSYDLHFTEEKQLVEKCTNHLINEVLHSDKSKSKDKLQYAISKELNQLADEILELAERPKVEPRPAPETGKPKAQQHGKRLSKQDPLAIPENAGVKSTPRTDSGLPRTGSSLSAKKLPRTSSMKSQNGATRSNSRPPLLDFLGRKLSKDSARSNTPVQSPMQSPKINGHLSYPRMTTISA